MPPAIFLSVIQSERFSHCHRLLEAFDAAELWCTSAALLAACMLAALLLHTSQSALANSRNLITLPSKHSRTAFRAVSSSAHFQAEQQPEPAATSANSFASKQAHVKAKKQFQSELSGAAAMLYDPTAAGLSG